MVLPVYNLFETIHSFIHVAIYVSVAVYIYHIISMHLSPSPSLSTSILPPSLLSSLSSVSHF